MSRASVQAPRVLVLANIFPAVSETFVVDHVMGLEQQGWSVTVAALKIDRHRCAALAERLHWHIEVKQIPASRRTRRWQRIGFVFRRLWATGGLRHLFSPWVRDLALASEGLDPICAESEPDLIHAHFGPNGIMAAFVARQRAIPLLVDFHGYDVHVIPQQQGWGPYRCFLKGARCIVHSAYVGKIVEKNLGADCRWVPLGVDPSLFHPGRKGQHWGATIRLLVVGRLVYLKGVHMAIDALSMLGDVAPRHQWRLTICGDGPERDALMRRVREKALDDRVAFCGALEHAEVAAKMAEADILLIPSIPDAHGAQEAFSRVAIEGMASGLGVVSFATGGLPETVAGGGKVVHDRSAMAMAQAVAGMLGEHTPAEWEALATARASQFPMQSMWSGYDRASHEALAR